MGHTEGVRQPLNWLATNATNDTNYIAFTTSLEPVRKEFMSFLNANRAEHEADLRTMQTVLSDTSTPAGIEVALKQLGKSADIRLAALGRKYLNTIGSPFPNLISDEGKQTLQRMGIESKALPARQNTPALEPGFVRFQDSRGGVHDIPQGNLKAAQQRDPNLRVMQQ
ncbi:MAG: hypothetical protein DMG77_00755 [Acidobacteria bacterium]|nr:MAG: hypothetical protein DMG77_00755 [Acidobacteriota bacterium]